MVFQIHVLWNHFNLRGQCSWGHNFTGSWGGQFYWFMGRSILLVHGEVNFTGSWGHNFTGSWGHNFTGSWGCKFVGIK
jgi:hypothetical protein